MSTARRLTVQVPEGVYEELVRVAEGAPEAFVQRLVEQEIARRRARAVRDSLMAQRARERADEDRAICEEFAAADDELWGRLATEEVDE